MLLAHKGKALAFFVLVTLTVAAATWLSPDIYRSEARVMLRLGRENVTLDPTAAGGQTVSISQTRRDELNSEMEIFRSRETVERVVSFPEVGKVINRLGLEGQCEGGIAQGIGYALMEQVVSIQGRIINDDLTRYPIPTAADVPPVEIIPIEVPEATGPYGAKGAAENATIPTAPAILDAISKAIGFRFTSIPVTPERIFQIFSGKQAFIKADTETLK